MGRVRFILKNGLAFTVCCESAKITVTDGELTGYKLTGVTQNRPLYIDFEQIAAIIGENPIYDTE